MSNNALYMIVTVIFYGRPGSDRYLNFPRNQGHGKIGWLP